MDLEAGRSKAREESGEEEYVLGRRETPTKA